MANSLDFTSGIFLYTIQFASASAATASGYQPSSTGLIYDIMSGTTSYDRRIYGLSATNTLASNEAVSIYLWDGVLNRNLCQVTVPASSGNGTLIPIYDIFSGGNLNKSTNNIIGMFWKNKDANGTPYFNLISGMTLRASYGTTLTGNSTLTLTTFGENYI